jgi:hypothetical protein
MLEIENHSRSQVNGCVFLRKDIRSRVTATAE